MPVSQWDRDVHLNALGLRTRFGHDDDGNLVQHILDDVEPLIDLTKAAQNDGSNGFTPSREMRRIAEIPMATWLEWRERDGVDIISGRTRDSFGAWHRDPEGVDRWLRRRLNDPDFRFLKTCSGRV